jgi:hypothetical protein
MLIGKPFLCIYCGDDADSLDHVLPWSFAEVIRRRKARAGKRAGLEFGRVENVILY